MAVCGTSLRVCLSQYRTRLPVKLTYKTSFSLQPRLIRKITPSTPRWTDSYKSKMALSADDTSKACCEPDEATKGFYFQQTMMRIKDPKASLEFYTKVMGMSRPASSKDNLQSTVIKSLNLVNFSLTSSPPAEKMDFENMKFSLYFMAYVPPKDIPKDEKEKTKFCFDQKATLELTHNWGTENDPDFSYHNGNSEPRGFGHIGMVVPDVDKACKRFEELGVKFIKKPNDGKMKGLGFIQDPDGYWIEILNPNNMAGSLKGDPE